MATVCCPIVSSKNYNDPNCVKCVLDRYNNALYFSRSPIPFLKKDKNSYPCFEHIGIYAFKKRFLDKYKKFENTPLADSEDLEQLRVLEYGYKIKVAVVDEKPLGIDTPEDMKTFIEGL